MGHPEDLLAVQQAQAMEAQLAWLRGQIGNALSGAMLKDPNHPGWNQYDNLAGLVIKRQNA